jgi:hypothetical protein
MIIATPDLIEAWLWQQGGWVSCDRICERWEVSDRRLRLLGAHFLVSRNGGYIHYTHATQEEINAWRGPLRSHAVSELRKINTVMRNRREGRLPEGIVPPGATIQPSLAL